MTMIIQCCVCQKIKVGDQWILAQHTDKTSHGYCPECFKIFEKEAALKIIDKLLVFHNNRKAKGSSVSAGFDMEFLFLASKLKYDIKEIPVQWRHVETKNVNFIKDAVESLKDILKIKLFVVLGKYDKK